MDSKNKCLFKLDRVVHLGRAQNWKENFCCILAGDHVLVNSRYSFATATEATIPVTFVTVLVAVCSLVRSEFLIKSVNCKLAGLQFMEPVCGLSFKT